MDLLIFSIMKKQNMLKKLKRRHFKNTYFRETLRDSHFLRLFINIYTYFNPFNLKGFYLLFFQHILLSILLFHYSNNQHFLFHLQNILLSQIGMSRNSSRLSCISNKIKLKTTVYRCYKTICPKCFYSFIIYRRLNIPVP